VTVAGVADEGIVVERSGTCLSVRAGHATAGPRPETLLRAEPGRVAVVVDRSASAALHRLDRQLVYELGRRLQPYPGQPGSGVRLLVGGTARPAPDGGPPLAALLADQLGVEVVAPDGPLVVLRRGELFSAGPAAAWWGFVPGGMPSRSGARFPEPSWQAALPPDLSPAVRSGTVHVVPVPSGLWVRTAGTPPAELSDPGFAVPAAPERLAILAGRPGEPPPDVAGIAEVVTALPPVLRRRYVLVPYGPQPDGPPLAQRLADLLGEEVRATHALPVYADDGSLDLIAVDGAGRAAWRTRRTRRRRRRGRGRHRWRG
jgi:hypothetical protein